jgi:hypothetical protein
VTSTPRDRACSSTSRSSSERVGNHTGGRFRLVADPPTALAVTAEGASWQSCAARAGSFGQRVLHACWLLDVSRLIASRMMFRAQGESPASCARELGLNPAAPML